MRRATAIFSVMVVALALTNLGCRMKADRVYREYDRAFRTYLANAYAQSPAEIDLRLFASEFTPTLWMGLLDHQKFYAAADLRKHGEPGPNHHCSVASDYTALQSARFSNSRARVRLIDTCKYYVVAKRLPLLDTPRTRMPATLWNSFASCIKIK